MAKTIPIEYVGLKEEGETDHLYGTGITWAQRGDVRHVPEDKAALLLNHADVWADARSEAAQKKSPIEPAVHVAPRLDEQVEEHNPAKIHLMPKEDLQRYALVEYNERIDPTLSESEMRAEITRLMHTRG